jgi:hypothetical protein
VLQQCFARKLRLKKSLQRWKLNKWLKLKQLKKLNGIEEGITITEEGIIAHPVLQAPHHAQVLLVGLHALLLLQAAVAVAHAEGIAEEDVIVGEDTVDTATDIE